MYKSSGRKITIMIIIVISIVNKQTETNKNNVTSWIYNVMFTHLSSRRVYRAKLPNKNIQVLP